MPVPVQLLPSPALDRSIVPYTVTNFGRIKDAMSSATRVHIDNLFAFGGWPLTLNFTVPFKCDMAIIGAVSCFSNATTVHGTNINLDGVFLIGCTQYFNEVASHKMIYGSNKALNVQAGAHTLTVAHTDASVQSDGSDTATFTLIMADRA